MHVHQTHNIFIYPTDFALHMKTSVLAFDVFLLINLLFILNRIMDDSICVRVEIVNNFYSIG